MDLAAIMRRNPQVCVVDELAHTNVPGSRHAKRYEDVGELLDAGIHVMTAVNIQHLETLNDAVARATGVRVRETVPDTFLDRADEVINVDVTVDELRTRLREGKIYRPEKSSRRSPTFSVRATSRRCANWRCEPWPTKLAKRRRAKATHLPGTSRRGARRTGSTSEPTASSSTSLRGNPIVSPLIPSRLVPPGLIGLDLRKLSQQSRIMNLDLTFVGAHLFGRAIRLRLAVWILELDSEMSFHAQAVTALGASTNEISQELLSVSLGGPRNAHAVRANPGDRRQYYGRTSSALWCCGGRGGGLRSSNFDARRIALSE